MTTLVIFYDLHFIEYSVCLANSSPISQNDTVTISMFLGPLLNKKKTGV